MSNRTDFSHLVAELVRAGEVEANAADRISTELHNAYVAGQEGHGCQCWSCIPPTPCEGEHSFYQARCEHCGAYCTGADFMKELAKFRASLPPNAFADAFCRRCGRLETRCDGHEAEDMQARAEWLEKVLRALSERDTFGVNPDGTFITSRQWAREQLETIQETP